MEIETECTKKRLHEDEKDESSEEEISTEIK